MTTDRRFYRTLVTFEILSEAPLGEDAGGIDLTDLAERCTIGDCSGRVVSAREAVVDGPTCARLLAAQESDPAFFGLTEDGEDLEDTPAPLVWAGPGEDE